MVVFGGYEYLGVGDGVWALSLSGSQPWTKLTPTGTPPPARAGYMAIYDPVRDRMVIFGGYDGSGVLNDVWALSLSGNPAWTELTLMGTLPSGRYGNSAIYDPVRDRMVVFGGYDGTYRSDVWALSLSGTPTWTELTPGVRHDARGKDPSVATVGGPRPSPRSGPSAIYDPVGDRMVVFGGDDGTYPERNDAWALSLSGTPAWTELIPAGTPPSGRVASTAIYDPVRDRMVIFGGWCNGHPCPSDAWALSLSGSPEWTGLWPTGSPPAGRAGHTAIYDPVRDRMVVFGGEDLYTYFNDVFMLSLSGSPAWMRTSPSARNGHTAIYDPVRDRMVVFGGNSWPPTLYEDVWALSLSGSPVWSELTPTGTPSQRYRHNAIYDPVRDRMVVFGGNVFGLGASNDVWALSLSANPEWTELTPVGTLPPARAGHTAIYDPVRDRMVIFAGGDGQGVLDDVWALSLSGTPTWTELTTGILHDARGEDPNAATVAGMHPSGSSYRAIYDPVRDRMVVLGGGDDDAWAFSLSGSPAWEKLISTGTPFPARGGQTAIYDPVRDRMVIFAGHRYYDHNDAWALSLSGTPTWTELTPAGATPVPRAGHTAIYDPVHDRMVVFGGLDFYSDFNDAWTLEWGTPTGVPPPPTRFVDALHPCYPNPFNPSVTIPFELREDASAMLAVYDVAGRLVKTVLSEWTQRGLHTASWDGMNESGAPVSSGVYFCRLRTDGFAETRKIVMLK